MVSTYQEAAAPKIRPPVADGQHQSNQLLLICRQGLMSRGSGATEEGDGVLVLEENGLEAVCRSVALNDEWLREVRQGQNRCRGNGRLEGDEGCARCLIPVNPSFFSRAVRGAAMAPKSLTNLR